MTNNFVPSKYQQPILELADQNLKEIAITIRNDTVFAEETFKATNINIAASAGSGKTTLLQQCFKIAYQYNIPFSCIKALSFVRKSTDDIRNKFKEVVEPEERQDAEKCVNTFNSLGLKLVESSWLEWNKSNPDRLCKISVAPALKKYEYIYGLQENTFDSRLANKTSILELVDKLREQIILRPEVDDLIKLSKVYSIKTNAVDVADWEEILKFVRSILYEGIRMGNPYYTNKPSMDFIDQCFLPVILGNDTTKVSDKNKHFKLAVQKFKVKNALLMVDEVQDVNPVLTKLIEVLNDNHNTVIIVGDNGQNIYGWRGSQAKGMDNLAASIEAKLFDLPISYRLANNHISLVKAIDPQRKIEPYWETDGNLLILDKNEPDFIKNIKPFLDEDTSKLFVARKRSSMILFAKYLISRGYDVKCKGFIADIKKYAKQCLGYYKKGDQLIFPDDPYDVLDSISSWERRTIQYMMQRNELQSAIDDIANWAVVLQLVFLGITEEEQEKLPTSFKEWEQRMNRFSSRKKNALLLNTVHASKGAEAETVIVIDADSMPINYSGQLNNQLQQEYNTLFVALTRAKHSDDNPATLILLVESYDYKKSWLEIAEDFIHLNQSNVLNCY